MSEELEQRLRATAGTTFGHQRDDAIEAADTLKRYREFIETLAARDDSIGDDARQALSDS